MKYTIVGDWYSAEDLAEPFVVVAEGDTYEEALTDAAAAVLRHYPYRAAPENAEGETPETLWGGDYGAYVCAAFKSDLSAHALDREESSFELIA